MNASSELRQRLIDLYAAMSSGSADPVEAMYSLQPGSVFIGTDESEFWTDAAQHNADVRPFFDGRGGIYLWQAREALARVEGTVGWTVDRPTLTTRDGGTLRARVTLIWHLEDDGVWRVVHSHASVGSER